MKYAKIYHFTCVTSANEVIYGGGYLTHMGHFDYNKQRISLYSKLSEINKRYNDLRNKEVYINDKWNDYQKIKSLVETKVIIYYINFQDQKYTLLLKQNWLIQKDLME